MRFVLLAATLAFAAFVLLTFLNHNFEPVIEALNTMKSSVPAGTKTAPAYGN